MDRRDNRFYREPPQPGSNFEKAVCALRDAVDSRGLKILLFRGSSYTSAAFRDALKELTSAPFSADRVSYMNTNGTEDGRGELTFARHLQLLTNAYVAALEYEKSARTA